MTTTNLKPTNSGNENISDIDNEIRKIVKEVNNIEQDLENIKSLLQQPQYKESYKNIRPFFENQKGFDALKDVLLFEKNRTLGKTTQENINVVNSMEVLKNIFVSNNNQAFEIQKNITDVDQSIKLTKEQSKALETGFQKKLKERSKTKPIVKLLRFLFTKIANKVFKEMEKERLGKPKEELNSLQDQFHMIVDSFNKELNSLMDAYGKGIENSIAEVSPYAVTDVTDRRFNQTEADPIYLPMKDGKPHYALLQKARMEQKQKSEYVAFDPDYASVKNEPIYVSAEEVRQLKKQQKAAAEGLKTEYQVEYNAPQHLQIHDLPKPQRAQISEKPKVAPKPSKEVIERVLSKAGTSANQKKVAPLVPQRGESSFKKAEELRNKFDVRRDELQSAGNVKDIAKKFEAKAQEEKTPVQNIIKQMRFKEEVKSSRLDSTQESARRFDTNRPNKLNIPEGFKRELEKITTTPSPSSSPTSSKKPFAIQSEVPKAQEAKQSMFYCTVSNGVPTPPPMPTEDDLKKAKLTSGKERDMTSQVNPKKRTVTEGKTTEGKNTSFDQVLKELYNLKERKANIEKNKPHTELTDFKIENKPHTPTIGG
ncbi:hypothetical protein [Candidatus Mesenet endosymbiont of Agriotes lineatus]|uniref:hypothetical protein n=1 Tax=Candidatus Mesenet endosymbiont of Agriotes lineatus TaxID=3077948 RepID=UPI0030D5F42B